MRLLFDENFNHRILRGLRIRLPHLDAVVSQDTELRGANDRSLLNSAAEQGRILVSHDVRTIPKFAYERISAGSPMPRVIVTPEAMPIGEAIEELVAVVECSDQREYINQVVRFPL
jgi:predicted nuclease of predicted toxin-antitoxin system